MAQPAGTDNDGVELKRSSSVLLKENDVARMSMAAVNHLGDFGELRTEIKFQNHSICEMPLTDSEGSLLYPTLQQLADQLINQLKEDPSLSMAGEQGRIVDSLLLLLRSATPRIDVYGPIARDCVGVEAKEDERQHISSNREFIAVIKMWNRVRHQRMASNARQACSRVAKLLPRIQPTLAKHDNDEGSDESDSNSEYYTTSEEQSYSDDDAMSSEDSTQFPIRRTIVDKFGGSKRPKSANSLRRLKEEERLLEKEARGLTRSRFLRLFTILWKMLLNPAYQVHKVFGLDFVNAFITFVQQHLPHLLVIPTEQQYALTGAFWALCYSPRTCEAMLERLGPRTSVLLADAMRVLSSFNSLTASSVLPAGRNLLCATLALSHTCFITEQERDEELDLNFAGDGQVFWHLLENNRIVKPSEWDVGGIRTGFYLKSALQGHFLAKLLKMAKDDTVALFAASMICNFYSARRAVLFAVQHNQEGQAGAPEDPAPDDSQSESSQQRAEEGLQYCYTFLHELLEIISDPDANLQTHCLDLGIVLSLVLLVHNVAKHGGGVLLGPRAIAALSGTVEWAIRHIVLQRSHLSENYFGRNFPSPAMKAARLSQESRDAFQISSETRALERILFLCISAMCYCFHSYPLDMQTAMESKSNAETFYNTTCHLIQWCRDQVAISSNKLSVSRDASDSTDSEEAAKNGREPQDPPASNEAQIQSDDEEFDNNSDVSEESDNQEGENEANENECINESDSDDSSASSESDSTSSGDSGSDFESGFHSGKSGKSMLFRSKTFHTLPTKDILVALEKVSLLTIQRSLVLRSSRTFALETITSGTHNVVSEALVNLDDCLSESARNYQENCLVMLLATDSNDSDILGLVPQRVDQVYDDPFKPPLLSWTSTADLLRQEKKSNEDQDPKCSEQEPNEKYQSRKTFKNRRGDEPLRANHGAENTTKHGKDLYCYESQMQLKLSQRLNHVSIIDSIARQVQCLVENSTEKQSKSHDAPLLGRRQKRKRTTIKLSFHDKKTAAQDLQSKLSLALLLCYHHVPHISESTIQLLIVMLSSADPRMEHGPTVIRYLCELFWALSRSPKNRYRLVNAGILRTLMTISIRLLKAETGEPDMEGTMALMGLEGHDEQKQVDEGAQRSTLFKTAKLHKRTSFRRGQGNGHESSARKSSEQFKRSQSFIMKQQKKSSEHDRHKLRCSRASFFRGSKPRGGRKSLRKASVCLPGKSSEGDSLHFTFEDPPTCTETVHCIVTTLWLLSSEEKNIVSFHSNNVLSFVLAVLDELVISNLNRIHKVLALVAGRPALRRAELQALESCTVRLQLGIHCVKTFMAVAQYPTSSREMASPAYFGKLFVLATAPLVKLDKIESSDPNLLDQLARAIATALRLQRVAAGAIVNIPWQRKQVSDPAFVTIATALCAYESPECGAPSEPKQRFALEMQLQELEQHTFGCHVLTKSTLTKKGHGLVRKVDFPAKLLDFAVCGVREQPSRVQQMLFRGQDPSKSASQLEMLKAKVLVQREDRRVQALFALSALCHDAESVVLICGIGLYKLFLVSWTSQSATVQRLCAVLLRQMNANPRNRSRVFKAELRTRGTQYRSETHQLGLDKAIEQVNNLQPSVPVGDEVWVLPASCEDVVGERPKSQSSKSVEAHHGGVPQPTTRKQRNANAVVQGQPVSKSGHGTTSSDQTQTGKIHLTVASVATNQLLRPSSSQENPDGANNSKPPVKSALNLPPWSDHLHSENQKTRPMTNKALRSVRSSVAIVEGTGSPPSTRGNNPSALGVDSARMATSRSIGSYGRIENATLRLHFNEWLSEELDLVETNLEKCRKKREARRKAREARVMEVERRKQWNQEHQVYVAPEGQGCLVTHGPESSADQRTLPKRFSSVCLTEESPLWANRAILPTWHAPKSSVRSKVQRVSPDSALHTKRPLTHRMCKPLRSMWGFSFPSDQRRDHWHPAAAIQPVVGEGHGGALRQDFRVMVTDRTQNMIYSYLFRQYVVNVPVLPGRRRLNMWKSVPGSRVYTGCGMVKYELPSHAGLHRELQRSRREEAMRQQLQEKLLQEDSSQPPPTARGLQDTGQLTRKEGLQDNGQLTRKEGLKDTGQLSRKEGLKDTGQLSRKEGLKDTGKLSRKEALELVQEARKELQRQSVVRSHKAGVDVSKSNRPPPVIGARRTLHVASQALAEERKKYLSERSLKRVDVSAPAPPVQEDVDAAEMRPPPKQNNGRRKANFAGASLRDIPADSNVPIPDETERLHDEAKEHVFLYYTGDALGMLRTRSVGILADIAPPPPPVALGVVGGGLSRMHVPCWRLANYGEPFGPAVMAEATKRVRAAVGEEVLLDILEHPLPRLPDEPPEEHLQGPRTSLWTAQGEVLDRPFPLVLEERVQAEEADGSRPQSASDLVLSGLASGFQENLSASTFQPWTLQQSVFAERPKWCDAKTFWDDLGVHKKALRYDLGRLMRKPEFRNWFDELTVPEEEEELLRLLDGGLYRCLANCFRFYAALGLPSELFLGRNEFQMFAQDAQLVDGVYCKKNNLEVIVLSVMSSRLKHKYHKNNSSHKPDAMVRFGKDKVLLRHEFIEVVFRVAELKFMNTAADEEVTLQEALEKLWENHLKPGIAKETVLDPDNFRNDRLYFKSVDKVLREGMGVTKPLFEKWTGELRSEKFGGRKGRMTIREWSSMWKWMGLLGPNFTKREAQLAFKMSIMHVDDEVTNWAKSVTLDYISFLEALGRVCELIVIPTEEQLQMLGADDIFEFYAIMSNCPHLWDAFDETGHEDDQSKLQLWQNPPSTDSNGLALENLHSSRKQPRSKHRYDSRPLSFKLNQLHILLAGFDSLAARVRNANLMFPSQKASKRILQAPAAGSPLAHLAPAALAAPSASRNPEQKPAPTRQSDHGRRRKDRSPLQQSIAAHEPPGSPARMQTSIRRSTRVMRTFSRLQLDELTRTPDGDSFEVKVARALHEAWRANRRRTSNGSIEPSEKMLHGKKYDITKLAFDELPSLYKSENLLAAHAACESIRWAWQRFVNEVESIVRAQDRPSRDTFYRFLRSSDFVEPAAEIQHVQYCKRHINYGIAVVDVSRSKPEAEKGRASRRSTQRSRSPRKSRAPSGAASTGAAPTDKQSILEMAFSDLPFDVKNKNRVVVDTAVEVYISLDQDGMREDSDDEE